MNTATLEQPSLFSPTLSPPQSEIETRLQAAENAAHAEKNQACLEAYDGFVREFARTHQFFTTDDISLAYMQTNLPKPGKDLRCTAVLIKRLKREGVLIKTGQQVYLTKWAKWVDQLTSPLFGRE